MIKSPELAASIRLSQLYAGGESDLLSPQSDVIFVLRADIVL